MRISDWSSDVCSSDLVCAAGASLAVAEHSVALQRRSLELTERGVQGGLFPSIDVTRSRALLAQLEAALPGYTAARRIALYRLAVLLGRAPQDYPANLVDCASIPSLDRPDRKSTRLNS